MFTIPWLPVDTKTGTIIFVVFDMLIVSKNTLCKKREKKQTGCRRKNAYDIP
jgi:hypothetical protein